MTLPFEFLTPPRIRFGAGVSAGLGSAILEFGHRAVVVTGSQPARIQPLLDAVQREGVAFDVYTVSREPTFEALRDMLARVDAPPAAVVGIGGGSVIDTAKALAMLLVNRGDPLDYAEVIGKGLPVREPGVPCIAVPTTAGAGSEATKNAVLKSADHGVKVSLRSPWMIPRVAVIDPSLLATLPPAVIAATGMDALSQLIEAFVTKKANAMTDALCREAIPRAIRSLERLYADPAEPAAAGDMSFAALAGGMALANAGLGAVHGFAAPVGGMFDAPHGAVCAILLPGVFRANFQALEKTEDHVSNDWKYRELASWITGRPGASPAEAADELDRLRQSLAIPGLAAYGITPADIPAITAKALNASSMKGNPVTLGEDVLAAILRKALSRW